MNIKKWNKFILEGNIYLDDNTFYEIYKESDIESFFNISFDDLKDIFQDILDEDLDIKISLRLGDHGSVFENVDYILIQIENNSILDKSTMSQKIVEAKERLKFYDIFIFYISEFGSKSISINMFMTDLETYKNKHKYIRSSYKSPLID